MRPTFVHLVVGFVLGAAVVASLALPGKVVITKQPPMRQVALPHLAAPLVVEAAPLRRTHVRSAPPAPSTTLSRSPVAPLSSVTPAQHKPQHPARRVPPSQPAPANDESLSALASSTESEKTGTDEKPKKEKRPKASQRAEETKTDENSKTEKRPKSKRPDDESKPKGKRGKENRPDEDRDERKDKKDRPDRASGKSDGGDRGHHKPD